MRPIRLYYRDGCHLCEDMLSHLRRLQGDREFPLDLIDVDREPVLRASYDTRVPVLETAEGSCLSEYFLDEVALLTYLDGG